MPRSNARRQISRCVSHGRSSPKLCHSPSEIAGQHQPAAPASAVGHRLVTGRVGDIRHASDIRPARGEASHGISGQSGHSVTCLGCRLLLRILGADDSLECVEAGRVRVAGRVRERRPPIRAGDVRCSIDDFGTCSLDNYSERRSHCAGGRRDRRRPASRAGGHRRRGVAGLVRCRHHLEGRSGDQQCGDGNPTGSGSGKCTRGGWDRVGGRLRRQPIAVRDRRRFCNSDIDAFGGRSVL